MANKTINTEWLQISTDKMDALTRLEKDFLNTNFVQYEDRFEGQKILADGTIVIGNRAGPLEYKDSCDISNLVHEMSHLVEIDDTRMRRHAWGLKLPEVWVYDRMCVEPTTKQITDRELRVIAYQINFLKYLGVRCSVGRTTSSLAYLADTCYVPLKDGSMPYGKGKNHELDYNEIKHSQAIWRIHEVNRLRAEYTAEKFIAEWRRKIEWLNQNKFIEPEY